MFSSLQHLADKQQSYVLCSGQKVTLMLADNLLHLMQNIGQNRFLSLKTG
jgi:hypothetical protein